MWKRGRVLFSEHLYSILERVHTKVEAWKCVPLNLGMPAYLLESLRVPQI